MTRRIRHPRPLDLQRRLGWFLVFAVVFFASYFLTLWLMPEKPRCETAYITIAASELCSAEKSCSLTIHDVEKYLKARRVHGECLREGAYD